MRVKIREARVRPSGTQCSQVAWTNKESRKAEDPPEGMVWQPRGFPRKRKGSDVEDADETSDLALEGATRRRVW